MDSNTACDWYTGRSCVGCYIWFSKEGPGRAAAHPVRSSLIPKVTTHQRPMYQLHIIRRGTIITCAERPLTHTLRSRCLTPD